MHFFFGVFPKFRSSKLSNIPVLRLHSLMFDGPSPSGTKTRGPRFWCCHTLGMQSPCQMMIEVYNHLLSKVFRLHFHSQKVIGSLGMGIIPTSFEKTVVFSLQENLIKTAFSDLAIWVWPWPLSETLLLLLLLFFCCCSCSTGSTSRSSSSRSSTNRSSSSSMSSTLRTHVYSGI